MPHLPHNDHTGFPITAQPRIFQNQVRRQCTRLHSPYERKRTRYTLPTPLARATFNTNLSEWFTIDNNPAQAQVPAMKQGSRSFMPASPECFILFQEITNALQNCGLANSHHDISLSRGASWVRSKCAKGGGMLTQQTLHFDYDTTAVKYDRLQIPMSIFVYFQATTLIVIDTEQNFEAGDILLLLGDCPHAGSRWTTAAQMNLRLFCFLPTKKCLPIWESGFYSGTGDSRQYRTYPDTNPADGEDLCALTNPQSDKFDLAAYNAHAFCSHTGKYFSFNQRSWYSGLQTICYNGQNCYRPEAPMFSLDPGVCSHWPSRSALGKAGMTEKTRACGPTFLDLRILDCPKSCSEVQKRSRSPSSSSVSSSSLQQPSPKIHKRVQHTHTHIHTHVAADGTVTETTTVCKQEILIIGSTSSSSSSSNSKARQ